jgi:hypothetical protein
MAFRLKTEEPQPVTVQEMPFSWPRPGISEYGPRVIRPTRSTRVATGVFVSVAVGIALVGSIAVAAKANRNQALLREGRVISAQVVDKSVRRNDGRTYYLSYRYTQAGQTVSDRAKVSPAVYDATSLGDPVEVTVLPAKPTVHRFGRITQGDAQRELRLGGLAVIGLFAWFGGLAWMIRGASQRQARILTDWTATSGQVLDVRSNSSSGGNKVYRVRLRYRVPRQAPIETETKIQRPGKWEVGPGSFVDVLFDPEDPNRLRLREGLTLVEIDSGSS